MTDQTSTCNYSNSKEFSLSSDSSSQRSLQDNEKAKPKRASNYSDILSIDKKYKPKTKNFLIIRLIGLVISIIVLFITISLVDIIPSSLVLPIGGLIFLGISHYGSELALVYLEEELAKNPDRVSTYYKKDLRFDDITVEEYDNENLQTVNENRKIIEDYKDKMEIKRKEEKRTSQSSFVSFQSLTKQIKLSFKTILTTRHVANVFMSKSKLIAKRISGESTKCDKINNLGTINGQFSRPNQTQSLASIVTTLQKANIALKDEKTELDEDSDTEGIDTRDNSPINVFEKRENSEPSVSDNKMQMNSCSSDEEEDESQIKIMARKRRKYLIQYYKFIIDHIFGEEITRSASKYFKEQDENDSAVPRLRSVSMTVLTLQRIAKSTNRNGNVLNVEKIEEET